METNKEIQTVNIFDREVSFFNSIYDKEPQANYPLRLLLTYEGGELMSKITDEYRSNMTKENKLKLPCFTPSAIVSTRTNDGVIKHSGLVCIDIDFQDNEICFDTNRKHRKTFRAL